MNAWQFTGNLGRDCESRYLPNGDAVVSFSVGVKAGFGDKATTTWARCSMFGKRGESVAPYLLKGQLVGVSGELFEREWDDKQGQKRTSLEVRVNDLTLLGKRDGASPAQQAPQPPRQHAAATPAASGGSGFGDFDDDTPF
jgi:single-strand DNA-binding protein